MADEAWTALNRIKTVIDALGVYKHTAIVSGETPEVALSSQQLPAVLIVDQGTTEEHVASDDGINHTLTSSARHGQDGIRADQGPRGQAE